MTWNSSATRDVAGEYAAEAQVADIVTRPYRYVVIIFFLVGQFMGLYGSLGPSKSTTSASFSGSWPCGADMGGLVGVGVLVSVSIERLGTAWQPTNLEYMLGAKDNRVYKVADGQIELHKRCCYEAN